MPQMVNQKCLFPPIHQCQCNVLSQESERSDTDGRDKELAA